MREVSTDKCDCFQYILISIILGSIVACFTIEKFYRIVVQYFENMRIAANQLEEQENARRLVERQANEIPLEEGEVRIED